MLLLLRHINAHYAGHVWGCRTSLPSCNEDHGETSRQEPSPVLHGFEQLKTQVRASLCRCPLCALLPQIRMLTACWSIWPTIYIVLGSGPSIDLFSRYHPLNWFRILSAKSYEGRVDAGAYCVEKNPLKSVTIHRTKFNEADPSPVKSRASWNSISNTENTYSTPFYSTRFPSILS